MIILWNDDVKLDDKVKVHHDVKLDDKVKVAWGHEDSWSRQTQAFIPDFVPNICYFNR